MARNLCGPITCLCLLIFLVGAVSLTFAGDEDERAADQAALARSARSIPGRGGRRGNEGIAVDSGRRGGRRRGNRRNPGGRRGGRRRGGRGRGAGREGRPGQSIFNRRELRLIGRLTNATSAFSLRMYDVLKQNHRELVFSPHSIHTALTMTYLGAREKTARQMIRSLGLKRLRKNKAHQAYAALINSMTDSGNVTLNVANAVYVKPNLPIEETFRTGLQNMYKADFDHFDYQAAGGPEAPINAWVEQKTENKIRNLLAPNTINVQTAMIILNAIYFKGNWKDKFDVARTSPQQFYQDDGSSAEVQMMFRNGRYPYTRSDELHAHIVELPYQDGRFAMHVILPLTRNRLADVEQRLNLARLNRALLAMQSTTLDLYLPKFKSESQFSLRQPLRSMRMVVPFSRRATFTGICSVSGLYISDVIHKAVVEVSEEGTEAAAATGVVITLTSAQFPLEVRADHPFIYAIRDNVSKAWLFMGKYSAQQ